MATETHDRLLPVNAMARRLGVRPAWLRAEIEAERLPSVRVGDGFLVHPETIVQLLADRAKGNSPEALWRFRYAGAEAGR